MPLAMCFLVTVFSLMISLYQSIQECSHINAKGYSIMDRFDTEELKDFFVDDESLNKLKNMYDLYEKEWDSEFYVMTNQPIYVKDGSYSSEFIYGYEDVDEEKLDMSYVECMQMNDSAIKGSNMDLSSGRYFYDNEYIYDKTVPIIVGYDYKKYLNINDTFTIDYLSQDINVKVVGILKEGACTAKSDYSVLDNFIIMPALEFPNKPVDKEDKNFQIKVYLGHTNSFVYSSDSALKVQSELDNICKVVDIKPFILMAVFPINLLGFGFAKSIYLLLLIVIAAFALIVAILSYVSWRKNRSTLSTVIDFNIKKDFIKIIVGMYLENMIWVLIAAAFCFTFSFTILHSLHINLSIIIISLCTLFFTIPLISIYKFFRLYSKEK